MLWKRYKNKRHPISNQLFKEEVLNVVTHLSALLIFSFLSGVLLVKTNYFWHSLVFCAANIHVFASSVFYHYFENKTLKKKLQLVDHSAINLLIAGTYTPLCVFTDSYTLLAVIWTIAAMNNLELFQEKVVKKTVLAKYTIMGWLTLFIIPDLWMKLPFESLISLIAGGVFYTIGTYFFINIKKKEFYHVYWHILCSLAAFCLYSCIYFFSVT